MRTGPAIRRWGVATGAMLCAACGGGAVTEVVAVRPLQLPVEFEESMQGTEFSGLCWLGEELLILPQYPEGTKEAAVWTLHADSLGRAIGQARRGGVVDPLRPVALPVEATSMATAIRDYDGLEAIVISGDEWFALAEYGQDGADRWGSRLLRGTVERQPDRLLYTAIESLPLAGPQMRPNFTHEALIVVGEEVWVLCELNARGVVDRPQALRFSRDLQLLGTAEMPALEYRTTDATELDADRSFRVLNLYWPPDRDIVRPEADRGPVEQLLPLRVADGAIRTDPTRPVLDLRGATGVAMHNWEGVARFRDEGFLLVSDSYPSDLLAFVPWPE